MKKRLKSNSLNSKNIWKVVLFVVIILVILALFFVFKQTTKDSYEKSSYSGELGSLSVFGSPDDSFICDNALISHYKFEDNYQDSQGNNHGTANGNPQFVDGKIGKSLSLDGVDDFVRIPDSQSLTINGEITISAWVALNDISRRQQTLISKIIFNTYPLLASGYEVGFSWLNPGKITLFSRDGISNTNLEVNNAITQSNNWYHVVTTIGPSGRKIYLNGTLIISDSLQKKVRSNALPIYIGVRGDQFGRPQPMTYLRGKIDEVKIWNYALSDEEIRMEYESGQVNESTIKTELIKIYNSGNDKMMIGFKEHRNLSKDFIFAKSVNGKLELMKDDDGRNITVNEMGVLKYQEYVVVGNGNRGYLLRLSFVNNQSTGYRFDYVDFIDIFSGDLLRSITTSEGSGILVVGGLTYEVFYTGGSSDSVENYIVRLNYPDSDRNDEMIVYPTIQTSLGAKVMFYEPLEINLTNWDGKGNNLSDLMIYTNGSGSNYNSVNFFNQGNGMWGISFDGPTKTLNTSTIGSAFNFEFGKLRFIIRGTGVKDKVKLNIKNIEDLIIVDPVVVIIEEGVNALNNDALIVTLEEGSTIDDGIGVNRVYATSPLQDLDGTTIRKFKDAWGSIIAYNYTDADQTKVEITYPDTQTA